MVSRSFNHTSLLELERRKWILVTDGVPCVCFVRCHSYRGKWREAEVEHR